MFINSVGIRTNIYAPFTAPNGTTYANLTNPAVRALYGILEIPDPHPPIGFDPDLYYVNEQDNAPYIIYTEKSPEQQAQVLAERARVTADSAAMEYAKLHPVVQFLATHTPQQCEQYVQDNVNDLAAAKTLLKQYAVALCVIARKEFRND